MLRNDGNIWLERHSNRMFIEECAKCVKSVKNNNKWINKNVKRQQWTHNNKIISLFQFKRNGSKDVISKTATAYARTSQSHKPSTRGTHSSHYITLTHNWFFSLFVLFSIVRYTVCAIHRCVYSVRAYSLSPSRLCDMTPPINYSTFMLLRRFTRNGQTQIQSHVYP